MKMVVAGSRNPVITQTHVDRAIVSTCVKFQSFPSVIFSGCAKGVDSFGEEFARVWNIPIEEFPADRNAHGKRAGMIRNCQMVDAGADVLVAVWDGSSHGTKHVIECAKSKGLNVFVYVVDPNTRKMTLKISEERNQHFEL